MTQICEEVNTSGIMPAEATEWEFKSGALLLLVSLH